ncbi:MAG: energy transducer TonB family protein [Brevundimonas sp.]
MMIKTAGGPGLVSPIDFHERKAPRLSKAAWIATGIVVAAHVGLGVALYYQRFEIPLISTPTPPPPFTITLERPEPTPLPEPKPVPPAAPNTRLNETSTPPRDVETVSAVQGEITADKSTTVNLITPSPEPADNAPVEVARPQPPTVITNPSWSRLPSADQMTRAYPTRAVAGSVAGSASLNCLVQANGGVTDCEVLRETPDGFGFGRAAQGLSRYFRVNPRTVNGAAEGSRVVINLHFNPPED